jgi:hypothetical protein
MDSRAVWRVIAILTVITLCLIGTPKAQATVVKSLIVVGANGDEVGPFGYSDSVEQGVVINLRQVLGQGNSNLWVLVPFAVSGVPENCPMNGGYSAANKGTYRYYVGTSCLGAAYLVATSNILAAVDVSEDCDLAPGPAGNRAA